MRTITTIGLDIAKSVFQVHGVDAVGQVVIRRQLKRRYVLAFFQKLPSFHSRASFCASTICAGIIFVATISQYLSRSFLSKTTT